MSRRPRTDAAIEARVEALAAQVRAEAVERPGVYRMHTADGEVLYVGKAKKLRTRLLSYFRAEWPKEKGARIIREAATLTWEYVPTEFAALLHELRLIKRLRPRMNVAMKRDARHFAFVRLSHTNAPRFHVVRSPGADERGVFYGPFIGAQRLEEALRALNDALGLRDCRLDQRMHFADQPELLTLAPRTPGCIRHEIGTCLGPCAGGTTEARYHTRVVLARDFLEGRSEHPLTPLRAEMEEASAALAYERAAALRDRLQRLEGLRDQFRRLRFAVESLSFPYHLAGHGGEDRVYLIHRGRVRGEFAAPRSATDQAAIDAAWARITDPTAVHDGTVPAHEIDELQLVSAWFAKHPQQLPGVASSAA